MKQNNNLNSKKNRLSFIELCQKTNLFEYGPVKGTIFFTPNGYALWTKIREYLDHKFKFHGVENVYFPSLIPMSLLEKEKKHIQGFAPEIFTINFVGNKEIKDKLVLRPTSEVIFCYYFQKVVHSYRDLPLLLNQWVNVWRWEQNPNPFLRNMEFLWQEGHTLHQNEEEAIDFCFKIWKEYQLFFKNYLAVPIFIGQKSEMEKFAGAVKTWTVETLLPDGQFLQLATVHYFSQNFTKEFHIQFLNAKNQLDHPHQTSWGLSTRALAALIQVHSDDSGLVLPFSLAKKHIAILKVANKNSSKYNEELDHYCQKIKEKLHKFNLQFFDFKNSKKSFGYQCNEAELMGVPIRLEIGIKELNNQTITYVLRHNLEKKTIKLLDFVNQFAVITDQINSNMFVKAEKKMKSKIMKITDFDVYKNLEKDKAFQVNFCNQVSCEKEIKELTQTVSRVLWKNVKNNKTIYQKCFKCQKQTDWIAIFGRSY